MNAKTIRNFVAIAGAVITLSGVGGPQPALQSALGDHWLVAALRHLLFGFTLPRGGCDDEFGCGMNSPILAGAEVQSGPGRPGGCDEWGCGTNSPGVDVVEPSTARDANPRRGFHELNVNGLPNAIGLSIDRVERNGTPYLLAIDGGRVVARAVHSRAPELAGSTLGGLSIHLRNASGRRLLMQVATSGTTPYWAGPSARVQTYAFTYTTAAQPTPQPLCTAGVNKAILFAGDRYDANRKTVTATGPAAAGWFNIACAGTALAKLHLTRHTDASQTVKTTADERQAMLKMFTADVCGDGTSFTVHGQPLLWADANHLTTFDRRAASLEAVWSAHGAVCLSTPRRPEFAPAIAARCGQLPRCTTERGYVISANPE